MTGADIAMWMFGAALALASLAFGVWKFMDHKINKAEERATEKAATASIKAELVQTDLAAHKLHVAEHYATKHGMTELAEGLTNAVNSVGDRMEKRLDGMTDRLDRVIEASHRPIKRHTD